MKKGTIGVALFLSYLSIFAQGGGNNEIMTGHEKIYVAITVLAIILSCIFIFLFILERRLKQLEQKQKR